MSENGRAYDYLMGIYDRWRLSRATRNEKKKISDPRRQALVRKVTLTKEQEQAIDELYLDNYGKKVPYDWHRMYTSYTGLFDARYIPELIFIPQIEAKFNSFELKEVLSDKNLLPLLVAGVEGVRTPKTYISCEEGCYRDDEIRLMSREKALLLAGDIGECFIKPTKNSCSGNGCAKLRLSCGKDEISGKTIADIFSAYGKNFVIQELLTCAESIRALHPASVNTFRVMSYVWGG